MSISKTEFVRLLQGQRLISEVPGKTELKSLARQFCKRIDIKDVPPGNRRIYSELEASNGEIDFTTEASSFKRTSDMLGKMVREELTAYAKRLGLPINFSSKDSTSKLEVKIRTALTRMDDTGERIIGKPAHKKVNVDSVQILGGKDTGAPKKSKARKSRAKHERDSFGSAMGTIAQRANAVLQADWVSDRALAKKAKLTLAELRGRYYAAAEAGVIERRQVIEYRLKPKAVKAPKTV